MTHPYSNKSSMPTFEVKVQLATFLVSKDCYYFHTKIEMKI